MSKKFAFFSLVALVALGLGLVRCVSRTLPESRFRDSQVLQTGLPVITVADPQRFTFSAVGDLHIAGSDAPRFRTILSRAAAEGDAFVVLLGDITDHGEPDQMKLYRDILAASPMAGKIFPIIGNHDVFGDGWSLYKQANGPSHYTFTVGNSKFIALDTADASLGEEQTAWLVRELANKQTDNVFILSHYLPIVPGVRTYLRIADEVEAAQLMKHASELGVTAWLGAHYHSFVTGRIDGVDYVVAGGGGGRRMDPIPHFFDVQVRVEGTAISYRMRKVD